MNNLSLRYGAVCLLPLILVNARAADNLTISNKQISVSVRRQDGAYEIRSGNAEHAIVRSLVGAQIDHQGVSSKEYPKHDIAGADFHDALGRGKQLSMLASGLPSRPDLLCILRVYDELPFGYVEVQVHNQTPKTVTVQAIRSVDAFGSPLLDLGSSEGAIRILSDGFTENDAHIADLGQAPQGMHRAVGSQLIYNRDNKRSLFFAALSADRFLTIMHLKSEAAKITSFTIDSTGTAEMHDRRWFRPPEDRIELSLPVAPRESLTAETVLFAFGTDYHAQLESYGDAIRRLHHARVSGDNVMGWWSWTSFYDTIDEGSLDTNAQVLADSLKKWGYDFFVVDDGYQRSRGEYTAPNVVKFPRGLQSFSQAISRLGINPGFWLAPLEVQTRAAICQNHQDWFVHNSKGKPILIYTDRDVGPFFVLDATHPGARKYLQQMVRTMTRDWGAHYLKLDFMDDTAIEGYYHRPHTTALEAQRVALQAIRDAVGKDVLLDKDSSPMLTPVGVVDQGRISGDSGHAFRTAKENAIGLLARYYMNRNFFVNDPDAFTIQREPPTISTALNLQENPLEALTLGEAQISIVLAAVSGGMFEIGDNLATLQSEPERMQLVSNPDLLHIVKLGRVSKPIDLLNYAQDDEQPSVTFLQEDKRESILAVFNWTEGLRSHVFNLSELGLQQDHAYVLHDVLNGDVPLPFDGHTISINDQPPHSVKLIKLIDNSGNPTQKCGDHGSIN